VSVRLGWTPDDKLRFACAYRLVAGLSWKCNVGEPVGGPNSRSAIRRRWPEVPGVDAWRAMELGQGRANRRFAPGGSQRGRGGDPDPRQQWTRWPALHEWLDAGTFPEAGLLAEAVQEWDKLTLIRTDVGDLWPTTAPVLVDAPKTYEVLADPHACQLLEICLGTLQPSDWAARSMRARAAWRVMSRSDVSERLGWTTNGARSEKS